MGMTVRRIKWKEGTCPTSSLTFVIACLVAGEIAGSIPSKICLFMATVLPKLARRWPPHLSGAVFLTQRGSAARASTAGSG
uniref:Uncharacterized protein n=1 Tax=Thermogemmatispora argillosa TaxID=2045280 RepID=A0A455T2C9_9CHLR|nr:hypothetical protein KTA_28960 [Thermogemmatispora argillosa]